MYCSIYKSEKKPQTYLYLKNKNDFSQIPSELKTLLGKLALVMVVPKRPQKDFALVSLDKLEAAFVEPGYYLQLPPPPINYLEQLKKERGL